MTTQTKISGAAAGVVLLAGLLLVEINPSRPVATVPVAPPQALYWEHDGAGASGYVVEESTNLPNFREIAFVEVANVWRTNASDYTYRFELTNKLTQAFYRVGAVPNWVERPNNLAFAPTAAPVESQPWTVTDGSTGGDSAEAVGTDAQGNVFIAANWQTFGGGGPMRLSKYSAAGDVIWHKVLFGTLLPHGIACDAAGNVFVAGEYTGQQNLGGTNLPGSISSYAAFLACYDSTGAHRWSIGLPGSFSSGNAAKSISIGPDGNPVITGYCSQMSFIGGSTITGHLNGSAFYAKFDGATGAHLHSRAFAGFGVGFGVTVDGQNRIAITGRFHGSIDFGGAILSESGKYSSFVAGLNGLGAHRWSHKFGSWQSLNGYSYGGLSASSNPDGDVSITGAFYGSMSIAGGPTIVSEPRSDSFPSSFVARLNVDGGHLWSATSGLGEGLASANDASGNSWFAGRGYLPGSGTPSSFLRGYSSDGDLLSETIYSCTAAPGQIAYGVAIVGNRPVICGKFSGTANFTEQRTSAGGTDIYLVKP